MSSSTPCGQFFDDSDSKAVVDVQVKVLIDSRQDSEDNGSRIHANGRVGEQCRNLTSPCPRVLGSELVPPMTTRFHEWALWLF
ncbi:unnamed protein product [Nippostrongylus brasiliensis]|uniref:Uncharacterized protein n=1 Tax=Nippostrongylus brasiliensis TaxID=27835 RepID=A0A0N4YF34_NIPBR|nr:unnamed protein product [Nippostrongylus brasiliensis]